MQLVMHNVCLFWLNTASIHSPSSYPCKRSSMYTHNQPYNSFGWNRNHREEHCKYCSNRLLNAKRVYEKLLDTIPIFSLYPSVYHFFLQSSCTSIVQEFCKKCPPSSYEQLVAISWENEFDLACAVAGYLIQEKCMETAKTFLNESLDLQECRRVLSRGGHVSFKLGGQHTLLDILDKFCLVNAIGEFLFVLATSSILGRQMGLEIIHFCKFKF